VLWRVLRETLILLHPFVPFVTEEIWHKLPGTEGSIMNACFPSDTLENRSIVVIPEAESRMETVMAVITAVRNIRGEMNIQPALTLDVRVQTADETVFSILETQKSMVLDLARLNTLTVEPPGERPKSAAVAVIEKASVFVALEGIIDFDAEAGRLEKELVKIEKELSGVSKKLNNEDFLSKAPEDVKEKVREKHKTFSEKHQKLWANLEKIKEICANR
jgi:valyl-tRNA synthetase